MIRSMSCAVAMVVTLALPIDAAAGVEDEIAALEQKGVFGYVADRIQQAVKTKGGETLDQALDFGQDPAPPGAQMVKNLKFTGTNLFTLFDDTITHDMNGIAADASDAAQASEWLAQNDKFEVRRLKQDSAIAKQYLPPEVRTLIGRTEAAPAEAAVIKAFPDLAKGVVKDLWSRVKRYFQRCGDERSCAFLEQWNGDSAVASDRPNRPAAPSTPADVPAPAVSYSSPPASYSQPPGTNVAAAPQPPPAIDLADLADTLGLGGQVAPKPNKPGAVSIQNQKPPATPVVAHIPDPQKSDPQKHANQDVMRALKDAGITPSNTAPGATSQVSRFSDTNPGSLEARVKAVLGGGDPPSSATSQLVTLTTRPSIQQNQPAAPTHLDPTFVAATLGATPHPSGSAATNLNTDLQSWDRQQAQQQLERDQAARAEQDQRLAAERAREDERAEKRREEEERRADEREERAERRAERREQMEERRQQYAQYQATLPQAFPQTFQNPAAVYAVPYPAVPSASYYGPPSAPPYGPPAHSPYAAGSGAGAGACTQMPAFNETSDPEEFERKLQCYLKYMESLAATGTSAGVGVDRSPITSSTAPVYDTSFSLPSHSESNLPEKNGDNWCAAMEGDRCIRAPKSSSPSTRPTSIGTGGHSSSSSGVAK